MKGTFMDETEIRRTFPEKQAEALLRNCETHWHSGREVDMYRVMSFETTTVFEETTTEGKDTTKDFVDNDKGTDPRPKKAAKAKKKSQSSCSKKGSTGKDIDKLTKLKKDMQEKYDLLQAMIDESEEQGTNGLIAQWCTEKVEFTKVNFKATKDLLEAVIAGGDCSINDVLTNTKATLSDINDSRAKLKLQLSQVKKHISGKRAKRH